VLDRVAPTALPRSSIVISDEPPNRETNYRTEFVVVLNNQPQGGLAMRERPDDNRVIDRKDNDRIADHKENDRIADRNISFDSFFGFGRWGGSNSSTPQNTGQNYYPRQR